MAARFTLMALIMVLFATTPAIAQEGRRGGGADRGKLIEEFDEDGDGELNEEERKKAREAMRERRGGRGGGAGGGAPGEDGR